MARDLLLIPAHTRSRIRRLSRQLRRRAMPRTVGGARQPTHPTAQNPQNGADGPVAPPPDHDVFAMEEGSPPSHGNAGNVPQSPLPPPPPQQPDAAATFATTRKDVRVWSGIHPLPLHVITMLDRRRAPPSKETWVMQADLNQILYSSAPTAAAPYRSRPTSGALYQLISRTPGARDRALMLRRSSTLLVTNEEWSELLDCMHSGVRSLTLLPRDVAIAAVRVFGPSRASVAVLKALGAATPTEWDAPAARRSRRRMRGREKPSSPLYRLTRK